MAPEGINTVRPLKIEVASSEFFSTNPKRLRIEENEGAGRIYFLKEDRVVAVAYPASGRV